MTRSTTLPFAELLRGGHPNSLGRTGEVLGVVLADPGRLEELFATVDDPDPVVRMRAGDALEKVCREQPGWLLPHVERLLEGLGPVPQPSLQWHVAQMLDHLRDLVPHDRAVRATAVLQDQLSGATDWIVLNVTMDVLARWARTDAALAAWLPRRLQELSNDPRRSVATRATRHLARLTGQPPG